MLIHNVYSQVDVETSTDTTTEESHLLLELLKSLLAELSRDCNCSTETNSPGRSLVEELTTKIETSTTEVMF